MNNYRIKLRQKRILADTLTPVGLYLKVRDRFHGSFLLESSDYHGTEHSFSYICCDPLASFRVSQQTIRVSYPGGRSVDHAVQRREEVLDELKKFVGSFSCEEPNEKFLKTGLFGYMAYDTVQYFEEIDFKQEYAPSSEIPVVQYHLFRYIIAMDHFRNECILIENYFDQQDEGGYQELMNLIGQKNVPAFSFTKEGEVISNFTDEEFLKIVKEGIRHCEIGDVFQVVFSRQFQTAFKGDEFQVYRALRSINPSPYLFYFDYGGYRIFGSSPEAQIVVKNGQAIIYPIAGTFRRTGDDQADAELARKLLEDRKENAEHIMLVDLARNDLSRSSEKVTVETYKEVQYYSHVIHLVSKVTGQLHDTSDTLDMVASTFPAGTLSGAPKYRAMELIDQYESKSRGFYGGAIGYMDFNGQFNHAIMIRTFMSRGNQLFYRAGAGIVAESNPTSEVQEVYNKLAALESAMEMAENI